MLMLLLLRCCYYYCSFAERFVRRLLLLLLWRLDESDKFPVRPSAPDVLFAFVEVGQ